MKKHISIIGALSSAMLLAGCFGTETAEPIPVVKDGEDNQVQNVAKEKLILQGEELKIHFEEIQAQRYVAMQAFQSFFPAVYKKEIRTSEYKNAIENIVAQYQYVYDNTKLLVDSYPDNTDFIAYDEIVRIETEQIIVPTLKLYYQLSNSDLLDFDEKLNNIKPETIVNFERQLAIINEQLSTNERAKVIAAKETLNKQHREIFSQAAKLPTANSALDSDITDDVDSYLDMIGR